MLEQNMAGPAKEWRDRGALTQSHLDCTALLRRWLAARDVGYVGDVPAKELWGKAARFAHLHPSALPPMESVLQGYSGEEPWRYIHLGYHPAEWMTARSTETETRHRFAYHGTSGYSASCILATGMICPSESKPGEVFKGAAGCGVGGYGRGVYTTFSFTEADKHAPATVLGIEKSPSGEPRADNDKAFWWPSPGMRGGESWRSGRRRRLGSENAPTWCRMTRVIGTRRRRSTTISKAGSIQSTKSSLLVILVTAVAKCRGLPRGMTWAARRTARFGLLVFLQPHRRQDVVQAQASPHQAPTGIHGMEYTARPAASACVVQRAGGAEELGAEAAEQQAAVGAGQ